MCVLRDGRCRGLLRMKLFYYAIKNVLHPEERASASVSKDARRCGGV